jgi:hypothetical protein
VFDARPVGVPSSTPGAYTRAEVWRDINPNNAGDNVYFELEPTESSEDTDVLGVWTSHIALLFGKPLTGADIQSIYPHA